MQRLLRIVGIASSFLCFVGASAAAAPGDEPMGVGVAKSEFGKTADGTPVDLYTLTNAHGMTAKIMTYGGIVTELDVPDRDGKMGDVVLGFDNLKGYLGRPSLLRRPRRPRRQPHRQGPVHARRQGIQAGDEQRPQLPARRTKGIRQGGLEGGAGRRRRTGRRSKLTYVSKDGEEGYPGTLTVDGRLHADQRQRAADRLHGDDGQGDAGQPDEPQLFQPGRHRLGRHPRPRGDDRGRQVHAGGRHADPDGRDRSR